MSTRKFTRRSAATFAVVICTYALVTAADKDEAPSTASTSAANSVAVESQVLLIGTSSSTVGVSISNSSPIAGFLVPLEIRPQTPGASLAQSFTYVLNPTGRVANSPLGYADTSVDSLWPEAAMVLRQTCVVCTVACSGPTSSSYCSIDSSCTFTTDPYGLFFGTVSTGDPLNGELINLEPGADPGTTADASLQIVLNQTGVLPGFFEIDTACWLPANSIGFATENGGFIQPAFTKGVIELRCDCPCHADPFCDGFTNIQDVVNLVDVAFRNEDPGAQQFCPHMPQDVNCDDIINIVDVIIMVDVAFRNADPNVVFCNPCVL